MKSHLVDVHQKSWQLGVIQLAGWMSLPTLATSILILQVNSFLGAVLTILVGNAILWFIRLGIIGMSYDGRKSTLDISREYFGGVGSYFIAVLLLVSTLAWFIAQTSAAGSTLTHLLVIREDPKIDQFTQVSVFLGIVSAFLCMEGIWLLRRLSTVAFPVLLVAFGVILWMLPSWSGGSNENALSLAGLTLVLATNLGLSSDLPTFFRHSESWKASVRGLLYVQLFNIGLGLLSLFLGALILHGFEVNNELVMASGNGVLRVALIVFIALSVICANVANVYSASVGWEVLAPAALVGRKEYLILGLGLTTIYILLSGLLPVEFLLGVSDVMLVNLCIVLVLGSMVTKKLGKGPDRYLQWTYFSAWGCASLVDVYQSNQVTSESSLVLNLAIIVSVVALGLGVRKLSKLIS